MSKEVLPLPTKAATNLKVKYPSSKVCRRSSSSSSVILLIGLPDKLGAVDPSPVEPGSLTTRSIQISSINPSPALTL